MLTPITAMATIVSVSGPASNFGVLAEIIAAPADVSEDGDYNMAQQGFDEIQGYTLLADLAVDGGSILAGTTVDSHMIFLNTGPGHDETVANHYGVEWLFSGTILGVMSNRSGSLEIDSTGLLGAPGTLYPDASFNLRGLEGNHWDDAGCASDCYSVAGNLLNLSMWVSEPGDWVRVVTLADVDVLPRVEVPAPGTLLLMGLGLTGISFRRRCRH
jgi:hypothetical protein